MYVEFKTLLWNTCENLCNIDIIINLFIEGSLISAKVLFSLRALFGATWIHSLYKDGLFD